MRVARIFEGKNIVAFLFKYRSVGRCCEEHRLSIFVSLSCQKFAMLFVKVVYALKFMCTGPLISWFPCYISITKLSHNFKKLQQLRIRS